MIESSNAWIELVVSNKTHTGLLLHFYYYFFGSHSQVFRLARSYSNHYLSSVRQHPQAQ